MIAQETGAMLTHLGLLTSVSERCKLNNGTRHAAKIYIFGMLMLPSPRSSTTVLGMVPHDL